MANPAESPVVHNPRPCIGYNPEKGAFGFSWAIDESRPEKLASLCPPHHAFFSTDDPGRKEVRVVAIRANCCPLPAADILTDDHQIAPSMCPPDYVVTGMYFQLGNSGAYRPAGLRCTRINTARYRLAKDQPGAYWGIGMNMNNLVQGVTLKKSDIPLAVRYEAGRMTTYSWDNDGCVGEPAGSLLAGSSGNNCSDFVFRELRFRNAENGRPADEPVTMFPDCLALSTLFYPGAVCIQ